MLARLTIEHEEHVVLVLSPVPRLLPEHLVVQERRLHLEERFLLALPDEGFQGVVERRALGRPECRAGRVREELEQPK